MPFSARTIIAVVLLAVGLAVPEGRAQAWHEGFETPKPSWRNAGGDARCRIVQQERLRGDSHSGNGCEWLRLETETGGHIYLAHDVGRPAIIDELTPSVWVKSDRPGLQLALRVVLPRTTDPRTGRPLATIIAGDVYTNVGGWQQLQVSGIPRLLTRQVHVLRMQLGPRVDDREAYLDAVLLNVYSGSGTSNLWIDDLDVAGHVAAQQGQPSAAPNNAIMAVSAQAPLEAPLTPVRLPPVRTLPMTPTVPTVPTMPTPTAPTTPVTFAPRHTVKLDRSILLVDGRPFFPRVIRHRGEPLERLKNIGFNAVWLQRLPSPEILEEASRQELWLICPPPRPAPDMSGVAAPMADIGPQFDCVLAWDLGDDLTASDLEATQRWADQVHAADRRINRPLICRPQTDLRGFSRPANVLLIDRRPLGTSFELDKWATWVRQQPLLASLGTPVWTTVQTQSNEALRQQLTLLEPGYTPPLTVAPEQIRLLAYIAVASGSRGLVFTSDTPLDAPDPDTRQRAMTLGRINLEMQVIDPWAAAGRYVATAESNVKSIVPSPWKRTPDPLPANRFAPTQPVAKRAAERSPAGGNEPGNGQPSDKTEVTATLLRTDRAMLLLPLWLSPSAQCVPAQSAANAVTLLATGVPEVCDAYELTPHGADPVRHQRVAGGLSVTLDEFGLTTQILLAHDPSIVGEVHVRAKQIGRGAAQLQRDSAVYELNTVQGLADRLAPRSRVAQSASWFDAARKSLQMCDGQLAAGDWAGAALNAQRACRSLRLIQRAYWDAAVQQLTTPITSPAAMSFDTLPLHWRFVDRLRTSRLGPNRIDGGDFEDLDTMWRAGWRHILHPATTVQTVVKMDERAAHSGRYGVRLAVAPIKPEDSPAVIESPPILFTSPSVQVDAGQIVCIHGWVRIPNDITASTDGLLIVDSLSGEALADRIGKTNGWRQFAMYRVAPQSGPMCVTFALSGIGEAWLDDVAIQVLEAPSAAAQR